MGVVVDNLKLYVEKATTTAAKKVTTTVKKKDTQTSGIRPKDQKSN